MKKLIGKAAVVAGGLVLGLGLTSGTAFAANGHDGVTEEICHPGGLFLRAAAAPDAAAKEHLENGWHFHIYWHADKGMVYGHSPILNMDGYVIDGYFC